MSRQDQYNVTVTIDGENLGTFDKLEGGEVDSEETKYKPGGMSPQVSLGGSVNVGNVTVSRLYDLARDHTRAAFYRSKVGKGQVTIAKQILDADGNAYGKPMTYTGKLKAVTFPEHDSTSSDPGLIALEISTAGTVA